VAAEGIGAAALRYPQLSFSAEDWLAAGASNDVDVDVVFSSNTLEHFTDPGRVLEVMSARARRAVVALVPFRERELIEEHHVSFSPGSLPVALSNGKVLVHLRVRDVRVHEPCYWPGEQALVVWADPAWLISCGLSADDLVVQGAAEPALSDLRERLERSVDVIHTGLARIPGAGDPTLDLVRGSLSRWVWLRTQGNGIAGSADRARVEAELAEAERILALLVPGLLKDEAVARLLEQSDRHQAEHAAERAGWAESTEALQVQLLQATQQQELDAAALAEAQRHCEIVTRRLQALEAELEIRLVEHANQVRSNEKALETARLQLTALGEQGERLEADVISLTARLETAASALVEAETARDRERSRATALEDSLRVAELAVREGQSDIALRDASLLGLRQRLAALEGEISILLGSRSWQVTRPLRAAARWVRRVRGEGEKSARRAPAAPLRAEPSPSDAESRQSHDVQGIIADAPGGVIHLVENFVAGGLERVALDLAERMARSGRRVAIAVAAETGPIADEARRQGVEVVELGHAPDALAALVTRLSASTVVAHHSYLGWREARSAGAEIMEVLHNAYHWQRGVDVINDLRRGTGAHCVAVSRSVRDYSIEHLGIPPERVALVNNGLNRAGFIRPPLSILAKSRLADVKREPCFLFMANLQLQKNHLLVISAFSKLIRTVPGARLVMAGMVEGECPMAKAVRAAAAPLQATGQLRITGSLDRRGLSRELAKAHVALLPTQYEGFSIATLEFAYFGLPSVLSRTGSSVELAERYGHVVLCEGIAATSDELDSDTVQERFFAPSDQDVESLRAAMELALDDYPRLLDAALDVAADYRSYDIDAVAERYCELLEGEWN
jgi:glycosyltransferase involved in cell wall biosynthesis